MKWLRLLRRIFAHRPSDVVVGIVFNCILGVCIVMAIGLTIEWYVAGGEDVRETTAFFRTVPRVVWIVSGIFAFYAAFILLTFGLGEFLKGKDQEMRDFPPGPHKGTPHSHN